MRKRRAAIARDTVAIVERGLYKTGTGRLVRIAEAVARAVTGTRLHLPADRLPGSAAAVAAGATTRIEVTGESSLQATRRLGGDIACLVFASAKNPGGGFLSGAEAQEESLARASALYACQSAAPRFYADHRAQHDLRYSDRVIYSPDVPVFRDDTGDLLDEPYPVSFLTAAAPNAGAILRNQPEAAASVPAVLRTRARRVLDVAAAHGHRRLVLGAWGCGVFANDPAVVAEAFTGALHADTRFDHVHFAVLDRLPHAPTYAAFVGALSPAAGSGPPATP